MVVNHLTVQRYEIYGYDQSIIFIVFRYVSHSEQVRIVQHTSSHNLCHLRKPLPSYDFLPILTNLRSNHSLTVNRYPHHPNIPTITICTSQFTSLIISTCPIPYGYNQGLPFSKPDYPILTHGIFE